MTKKQEKALYEKIKNCTFSPAISIDEASALAGLWEAEWRSANENVSGTTRC